MDPASICGLTKEAGGLSGVCQQWANLSAIETSERPFVSLQFKNIVTRALVDTGASLCVMANMFLKD